MRGRSERRRGPAAARGLVATRRTTEENKERANKQIGQRFILSKLLDLATEKDNTFTCGSWFVWTDDSPWRTRGSC